ncbi:PIN domain-containing protein [Candidatus Woesearchaeota archaeon]|nr:PIN domain-containing protein [Candidatus Woesearchaeota archaeon]
MKKTDSKLIDSSLWLAYLFNDDYSDIIDSDEILLLSVLSLFEIKRKLLKSKVDDSKIIRSVEFVKKRSLMIPVSEEISEKAVDFSFENNLSTVDSIIYATAVFNDAVLLTLDNDFRNLENVIVK